MSYSNVAYKGSVELPNGDILRTKFGLRVREATFNDPQEEEEVFRWYFLNGKEIELRELPKTVTNEILSLLDEGAIEDSSYDWSGL